jgi:hypothetical protein
MGQGAACQAVMGLLDSRSIISSSVSFQSLTIAPAKSVMKSVAAVIQIVGHSRIPLVPKQSDELRSWYIDVRNRAVTLQEKA